MAMTTGNKSGFNAEINITPMIDVLLVLLIIFMVIVPMVPRGLSTAMAQSANAHPTHDGDAVVVRVAKGADSALVYHINGSVVALADLQPRLTAIYANRADRSMFVKGDGQVSFQDVARVIDIGRAASADRIGLMPRQM